MIFLRRCARAVLAALLFLWALLTHAAITVVDDRGVAVSLPASPQRIVSLLPSLTETVCELGACARIVGTDRYSNFPASVRALPKTGGLDDANVEMIVALKPDVVLLAMSARVTDRLEAMGIRVLALEPKTYEDVRRVAGKVAQALGLKTEGEALWRRMERQMQEAAALVPASAKGMSVYYEVDSAPYAAGESSFIGYNLHALGVNNIVPSKLGPFPKLNPEYVVRADPQVIMLSARNAPGLSSRPGWDRIRAIRDKRICAFTPEQGDVLSRPGPRMGEAARILALCLRDVAVPGGGR
ncbi:MAG: ABC transporter substrate-binding protein [Aquabacterium sp.]|uniref:ABC transporter substrate-binding protein n=1 Tax=Aquabacterium sp. TaxID=1872578 RepID=UPI0011FCF8E3|nr:helical backbone metal receptor [Aquabacterium sp.]TAK93704.1 MAG: ABC transporter substrate-binding protein [Aquabacterium sp.]